MARYINADALIEDLFINHNTDLMAQSLVLGQGFDVGVNCVKLFIDDAPSIEIVRCGECKHMKPNGECNAFAGSMIRPSASDFCSCGERKERQ